MLNRFSKYFKFSADTDGLSPSDVTAEVTGSADIHHLSNMAFFRKARSEVRAGQSGSTRGTLSSSGLGASPNTIAVGHEAQQISRHNTEPGMNMDDPTAQQNLYTGATGLSPHVMDTSGGQHANESNPTLAMAAVHDHASDMQNMQPSIEDYIRTADGINNYLTYHMSEISELPPWITFDLPDNPG